MCLAVPGRVLDIGEKDGTRMATVDFGGVQKEVCLEYLPDLQVGEYAIVHVGFALQRLDEESARQTLALFEELGMLQEEFGDPWEQAAAQAGADSPWPFADGPYADGPYAGEATAPQEAQEGRQ
ncbi:MULTISPECIES: HypC/HybG/HupF family hydrogenase formation chaperone [Streptomyces]|uniref:Ni/Fe hydrogenase formation protein n=1 Tax=Streptomyces virginiae TaxID=1961 RepID=A0ABQ3NH95_STRVG|nr:MULTISPECIES: HypC/HybG/HupF family hydrogenase formation chaperone [Streptomyces]KOU22008.1 Ni/Fe hydrogenase formation protein [Streptomyces sp. WM6349]KOU28991.1 Ni/Fe hydrogenase formation protein [Streptomyces sp. WM6373]KOU67864.1 Ni/Fe hydrogenase formation protein [Streptomyces sp. IGB124]KOU70207.1 Ni/Fe hydrogenase formation protein [Streptomyces sp. XY66]KOU82026.1 Ni/Fe hydrogenase formation protein [Streptomyces sp. XY593]